MKKMAIMICVLCLLYLVGCQQKRERADEKTIKEENQGEAYKVNDTKDGVLVDDLLDSVVMLGKTAEEIGIPREVIETESEFIIKTYIDGSIFGTEDYGVLYFKDAEDFIVESVWLHIKNINYEECKKELSEKFGEPTEEGENPYVEVDGGSVEWSVFQFEDVRIRLSSASERSYREISIEKVLD